MFQQRTRGNQRKHQSKRLQKRVSQKTQEVHENLNASENKTRTSSYPPVTSYLLTFPHDKCHEGPP